MSPIYNHSQGLKLETGQNHHFWGISCRKKLLQQKIYYDFNVSIWNVVCLCFYLFDIFLTLISLESSYFLTNYIFLTSFMPLENNQVENKSLNLEQKLSIKIEKDVSSNSSILNTKHFYIY